jgi:hypothetical protein
MPRAANLGNNISSHAFSTMSITQLTEEEATAFYHGNKWQAWDAKTRAIFQLQQERMCMPFKVFRESIEESLGRKIIPYELLSASDSLLRELQGLADPPSLEDVLALVPPHHKVYARLISIA